MAITLQGTMRQLAQLRDLLHSMEQELGLTELNPTERDILLAFYAQAEADTEGRMICRTDLVRQHPTIRCVSQPTFHRALKRLIEKGLIRKHRDRRTGVYMLPDPGAGSANA